MYRIEKQGPLLREFHELNYEEIILDDNSKESALSKIFIKQTELKNNKQKIIKQIYLLNKIYKKTISSKKRCFDNHLESFVLDSQTQNQNKLDYKLLVQQFKDLMNEINIFAILENITKKNVKTFEKEQSNFNHLLTENKIVPKKSNTFFTNNVNSFLKSDINSHHMPSVAFCKNEVKRKFSYVNDLLELSTTCNFKGENYEN